MGLFLSILSKFYAILMSILGHNAITKCVIYLNMGLTSFPFEQCSKKLHIWKRGTSLAHKGRPGARRHDSSHPGDRHGAARGDPRQLQAEA